jgi:hypothetical protein
MEQTIQNIIKTYKFACVELNYGDETQTIQFVGKTFDELYTAIYKTYNNDFLKECNLIELFSLEEAKINGIVMKSDVMLKIIKTNKKDLINFFNYYHLTGSPEYFYKAHYRYIIYNEYTKNVLEFCRADLDSSKNIFLYGMTIVDLSAFKNNLTNKKNFTLTKSDFLSDHNHYYDFIVYIININKN